MIGKRWPAFLSECSSIFLFSLKRRRKKTTTGISRQKRNNNQRYSSVDSAEQILFLHAVDVLENWLRLGDWSPAQRHFLVDPVQVGRHSSVYVGFAGLVAADAPRDDAGRDPTIRRRSVHQRAARIALKRQ